jgi:Ca-activated chloride channel family protein
MLAQVGEHDFKLKAAANLVMLEVSAKDREGRFVSDLTRGDFRVCENGKAQTISQFSKDDAPVTIGLAIDDSGGMKTKYSEVINSAMIFLSLSNPKDEVFIVHFNDSVRVGLPKGVPFSDNPALLKASVIRNPAEGRTALYDAILFSLKHLNSGRQEKKSLLLISDGGDNASTHKLRDVMKPSANRTPRFIRLASSMRTMRIAIRGCFETLRTRVAEMRFSRKHCSS